MTEVSGRVERVPDPPPLTASEPSAGGSRSDGPPFGWSWKLGAVSGIDIYVHGTFLLLLVFLAFSDLAAGNGIATMGRRTLLIVAVFFTVVLHEYGHALTARRFGVDTRDITLLPIGGVARLEKMPDEPKQQLLVALAGPAVSLVVAGLLFIMVWFLEDPYGFSVVAGAGAPFLTQLMWINVFLAAFNMLPGYPMDGGRVLRALLAMRLPAEEATQRAARVGQFVALAFGFAGLFGNPLLILIAAFIWFGAQAEHSASTVTVALAGHSVRQGMITDFQSVAPTEPLSRAVALTLAGFQQDFPVMEGTRPVGILTYTDILANLSAAGADLPVQQAMQCELQKVSPSESLNAALTRMRLGRHRLLIVVEGGEVVGVLTVGNILELMALERATRHEAATVAATDGSGS